MERNNASEKMKIHHFTDLRVWQEGHTLALLVYQNTAKFPKEERFGLSSQMQRAAVSITSNIAEGFGRSSAKEKLRFYDIARGSLLELENQMILARDLLILPKESFNPLQKQLLDTHKLINALTTSTRSRL